MLTKIVLSAVLTGAISLFVLVHSNDEFIASISAFIFMASIFVCIGGLYWLIWTM